MTVKECRKKSRLTEQEIATRLGISKKKYLLYENEPYKMPTHIAISFSRVVNIPIDSIFFTT